MEYLIIGIILFIVAVVIFYFCFVVDWDLVALAALILILGILFITQFFIRCPECDSFTNDFVFRDDYCSECGYCYNPRTYCDCGSSYPSNNLPRFCPDCGLVLDIGA